MQGHSIELRVLLLQWADEAIKAYRLVMFTLYVDDASIEAAGPAAMVEREVNGAVGHFVASVQRMGMEFSPTKNCCIASCQDLAGSIARAFPGLGMTFAKRVKSLGGALGDGRVRNNSVSSSV